jgi:hypothetical protein
LFHKVNSGFSQINQWFNQIAGFESLPFAAFAVSCVPVLFGADKAIIKQSKRKAKSSTPSILITRVPRHPAHGNRYRGERQPNV